MNLINTSVVVLSLLVLPAQQAQSAPFPDSNSKVLSTVNSVYAHVFVYGWQSGQMPYAKTDVHPTEKFRSELRKIRFPVCPGGCGYHLYCTVEWIKPETESFTGIVRVQLWDDDVSHSVVPLVWERKKVFVDYDTGSIEVGEQIGIWCANLVAEARSESEDETN